MEFNLLEYQTQLSASNVLLYYKGPLDPDILSSTGKYIRKRFTDYSPKTEKKVFSIFMEMAQNISLYSAENNFFGDWEDTYGVGTIVIIDDGKKLSITSGNLVKKEQLELIVDRCKKINTLDREGLRKYRSELRNEPVDIGESRGNIGLVHIAIKSENPLEVKSYDVDEEKALFVMSVYVEKEN